MHFSPFQIKAHLLCSGQFFSNFHKKSLFEASAGRCAPTPLQTLEDDCSSCGDPILDFLDSVKTSLQALSNVPILEALTSVFQKCKICILHIVTPKPKSMFQIASNLMSTCSPSSQLFGMSKNNKIGLPQDEKAQLSGFCNF